MRTMRPISRSLLLVFVLVLSAPTSVGAAEARVPRPGSAVVTAAPTSTIVAWSFKSAMDSVLGGTNNRSRVIQFVCLAMCLGLFIMLRK